MPELDRRAFLALLGGVAVLTPRRLVRLPMTGGPSHASWYEKDGSYHELTYEGAPIVEDQYTPYWHGQKPIVTLRFNGYVSFKES